MMAREHFCEDDIRLLACALAPRGSRRTAEGSTAIKPSATTNQLFTFADVTIQEGPIVVATVVVGIVIVVVVLPAIHALTITINI